MVILNSPNINKAMNKFNFSSIYMLEKVTISLDDFIKLQPELEDCIRYSWYFDEKWQLRGSINGMECVITGINNSMKNCCLKY